MATAMAAHTSPSGVSSYRRLVRCRAPAPQQRAPGGYLPGRLSVTKLGLAARGPDPTGLSHLPCRMTTTGRGRSMDARESIWETCEVVERHTDRLSGAWIFAGTRVPISALFDNLNEGVTIDEFLDWYEGVPRTAVEAVIARQMEHLRSVTSRTS